ncbi:hypothetical protein [Amycolatopsis speibonae]|uniref:TetR/AcrR family transcriptional regulator n=1 Tax=Amycolatopsis speibonae TaxID=1450224 RepID=A0ABV7P153_9PSEU
MGRLADQTRAQKETTSRAAMDRLLCGEIPPGGKCDGKTLAAASGVTRAALYSTYLHLKEEFERRRDQLREASVIADPRDAQIDRLKEHVGHSSSGCHRRTGERRPDRVSDPGRVTVGRSARRDQPAPCRSDQRNQHPHPVIHPRPRLRSPIVTRRRRPASDLCRVAPIARVDE